MIFAARRSYIMAKVLTARLQDARQEAERAPGPFVYRYCSPAAIRSRPARRTNHDVSSDRVGIVK
jgi:hypothetical protein